jgi:hypothetical protein
MRELSRLCRAYCHENHKIWANSLPHFARLLNVVEHRSTSRTPYEVRFGKTPDTEIRQLLKLPVDAREDNVTVIQLVHKSLKRKAGSQKAMAHQFQRGNLVLLKANNISSAYDAEIKKYFCYTKDRMKSINVFNRMCTF